VIVRRLEESAEGCRWMLERWAELRHILERKAIWADPEMLRFVGLLGKHSMKAVFDPKLNSIFLAFNALGRRFGQEY
jgi:extradiol dioxygenase family protein